jgi:hypothetical protein
MVADEPGRRYRTGRKPIARRIDPKILSEGVRLTNIPGSITRALAGKSQPVELRCRFHHTGYGRQPVQMPSQVVYSYGFTLSYRGKPSELLVNTDSSTGKP